jgi:histidyl-tRNA synthetase
MSQTFERDEARNYQGTRDWFGDEARWHEQVVEIIKNVFERFGFEPLITPALETLSTLKGKAGEEADTNFFKIRLPHPDEGGLRFDHTVPLARFAALNWNVFTLPYSRYAIGPVWRNDKTQAGRYKEFWQLDFDTIGVGWPGNDRPPSTDADIVALEYLVLTELGFPKDSFKIQVNDRRLLDALAKSIGVVDPEEIQAVFRAWDKFGKTPRQQINQELRRAGLSPNTNRAFNRLTDQLQEVSMTSKLFGKTIAVDQALIDLNRLFDTIDDLGVPQWAYNFNPLLARGLSYYTGPIYEASSGNLGSISGGGRFDRLIQDLGGPDLPATGASFGLERIMAVMEGLGLKPESSQTTQVFVTLFDHSDQDLSRASLRAAGQLRQAGINTLIYSGTKSRGKQLQDASKKNIPFAIIIGPKELSRNEVLVRNTSTRKQKSLTSTDLVPYIKKVLSQ